MKNGAYSYFSRLRVAMWSRGMSIEQLRSGGFVSSTRIKAWENEGRMKLSPQELDAICVFTGFPKDFFSKGCIEGLPSEEEFVEGESILCASAVLGMELNDFLRKEFNYPTPCIPQLKSTSPEKIAQELRVAWNVGESSLTNVVQLLESKGVGVFGVLPGTDLSFLKEGKFPCIFVPLGESAPVFRFEVVKQLGELILFPAGHGGVCVQDVERDVMRFAVEFCIPEKFILEHVGKSLRFDDVAYFSSGLKVPFDVFVWKLWDMGLLNTREYSEMLAINTSRDVDGSVVFDRSRLFDVVVSDVGGLDVLARKLKFPFDVLGWLMLGVRPYAVFGSGAVELGTRRDVSRHLHVVK